MTGKSVRWPPMRHPFGKEAEALRDVATLPSGRIDRRFGNRGRILFASRRDNTYTPMRSVVVLPSGRLLAAGYRPNRLFVVRLWPSGRLDRSFGDDGMISFDLGFAACCPIRAGLTVLPGGGRSYSRAFPAEGGRNWCGCGQTATARQASATAACYLPNCAPTAASAGAG
jgi:hypothetical protein